MKIDFSEIDNNSLYEFYTDVENTDKFSVGYIVDIDEQYIVIEEIDPYGNNDGWSCFYLDDIIRYQVKSRYLDDLSKLCKYNGTQRKNLELFSSSNLLYSIFNNLVLSGRICIIELCDSYLQDVVGRIKGVDTKNEQVNVELVNSYGDIDGETIIDVAKISHLSYDNSDTKKIEILQRI